MKMSNSIRKNVLMWTLCAKSEVTVFVFYFCRAMGRSAIVFATTMFKAVCYSEDESQIITAGTDRKVSHTVILPLSAKTCS